MLAKFAVVLVAFSSLIDAAPRQSRLSWPGVSTLTEMLAGSAQSIEFCFNGFA
jgi:hypothetical protein